MHVHLEGLVVRKVRVFAVLGQFEGDGSRGNRQTKAKQQGLDRIHSDMGKIVDGDPVERCRRASKSKSTANECIDAAHTFRTTRPICKLTKDNKKAVGNGAHGIFAGHRSPKFRYCGAAVQRKNSVCVSLFLSVRTAPRASTHKILWRRGGEPG